MRITDKTLYTDIINIDGYITPASKDNIIKAAESRYKEYYALTISEFFDLLDKDYTLIEWDSISEPTILQYYYIQGFARFVAELQKVLERLTLKPSSDEQRNMSNLLPMTFAESIIVFAQDFFGLQSYKDTESNITIGDIVLAKKVHYNRSLYQRNMMTNLKTKQR